MNVEGADLFDVQMFLAQPLIARVAAAGPSVRPVWYLWEEDQFWWLTGSYAKLPRLLAQQPQVSLVIDTCDLTTGTVRQLTAWGDAQVVAFDAERARRKLIRYLGPDEDAWDERFNIDELARDPGAGFVRLAPQRLLAKDLSFRASS